MKIKFKSLDDNTPNGKRKCRSRHSQLNIINMPGVLRQALNIVTSIPSIDLVSVHLFLCPWPWLIKFKIKSENNKVTDHSTSTR